MDTRKISLSVLLAAAAFALASCGGGGDGGGGRDDGGDPAPAPGPAAPGAGGPPGDPLASGSDVPLSATASADGAFAFVASLVGRRDDRAEPLRLGDARLAASESADTRDLP